MKSYFLSAFSGALIGVACPPTDLHFLSWIGFAIFGSILLREVDKPVRTIVLHFGYLSLFMNLLFFYWFFPSVMSRTGFGYLGTLLTVIGIFAFLVLVSMVFGYGYAHVGRFVQKKDLWLQAIVLCIYLIFWDTFEIRAFPYTPIQFILEEHQFFAAIHLLKPLGLRVLLFGFSITLSYLFLRYYRSQQKRSFWSRAVIAVLLFWGIYYAVGQLAYQKLHAEYSAKQPVAIIQDNMQSFTRQFAAESGLTPGQAVAPENSAFLRVSYQTKKAQIITDLKGKVDNALADLQQKMSVPGEAWLFWSETYLNRFQPEIEWQNLFTGFIEPIDLQFVGYNQRIQIDSTSGKLFNAAAAVHRQQGYIGSYLKNILFPIGEYIPFESTFPILRKWFPKWGRYSAAEKIQILAHPDPEGPVFVTFICYEGIFGSYVDKAVAQAKKDYPGRNIILVNPTSDFRFGVSRENIQHSMLTRFHVARLGLPMVRPNGFGFSEIIAPWGEALQRSERDQSLVLAGFLPVKKTAMRKVGGTK